MLSFLKEQNRGDMPAQQGNETGMESAISPDTSEEEYLTVEGHSRRTRRSTIVLAVLFISGLCGLWFMVKKSTPQAASASDGEVQGVKLESAIERLTGVKSDVSGKMDKIVNKFYEFSEVPQVQVGELSKNPFKLQLFFDGVKDEVQTGNSKTDVDIEALWKQQIRQKAEGLGLSSIMQSDSNRGNCCMIGSSILYEGDLVDGFKVVKIGDDFVKLQWESKADDMRFGDQTKNAEVILRMSN